MVTFNKDHDDPQWEGLERLLGPADLPPPASRVQVDLGARTRRGPLRTVNEDHYLVIRLARSQETVLTSLPLQAFEPSYEESGYAMIVADGMGETGSGEVASRLALVTLLYLVRYFGKWNLRVDEKVAREIIDRARRFYRQVDSTVVHHKRATEATDLQTTLTATFSAGRDLFFAHVGHSRAYLYREGQLLRLSRDQTLSRRPSTVPVAPLVDVNRVGRDLAHIVTDTIGMGGTMGPQIDLERILILDGDVVLVCTNGLTDAVDEMAIGKVLSAATTPDEKCQALVDLAAANDARDDVTALVAIYRVP